MKAHDDAPLYARPIPEWAGVRLCLASGKVAVARALLAVRRGDRLTAEQLLVDAQRDLTRAEIAVGDLVRGER
jgi:hypothetical protein